MKKNSKAKPVTIITLAADSLAHVRGGARVSNSPIDQGMQEAGQKADIAVAG